MTTATFPETVPVLTDGVVTLRAHHAGDVDGVLEQCLDPVSQAWTTVPASYTRAMAEGFVGERVPAAWAAGSWVFAVEADDETGTPRFCGTVELRDEGDARAEIAYGAHPWARGRGIVHRALELLLAWGFEEQGLRTVIWWANRGNWASRRAAWRLGFTLDGTVSQWLPQRGELLDAWVGVLRAGRRAGAAHRLAGGPSGGRRAGVAAALAPRRRGPDRAGVQRRAHPALAVAAAAPLHARRRRRLPRVPAGAAGHRRPGSAGRSPTPRPTRWSAASRSSTSSRGRDAEIGYWAHPDARGRGVMSEACGLAVRHAFTPPTTGGLGLQRLRISAAEGNAASHRVIVANGFVPPAASAARCAWVTAASPTA